MCNFSSSFHRYVDNSVSFLQRATITQSLTKINATKTKPNCQIILMET